MSTRVHIYEPGYVQLQGAADLHAVWPITDLVADDARRYVPVLTGDLRSTIRPEYGDGYGRVWAGAVARGIDYHMFVEDGTSKMGPQPYLRPALYQTRIL